MTDATDHDSGERGGATGVEMALLWIAMLLLISAVVQVALAFYARQLALTAAQEGARSGRYLDAVSADQARAGAENFLARAAGPALQGGAVTVDLDQDGGILRVRVTGTVLSLIPGVELPVDKSAAAAVERIEP